MSYFVFYCSLFSDLLLGLGKSLLSFTCSSERFPLSLGAWDWLRYFIVALPEPLIIYSVAMLMRHGWSINGEAMGGYRREVYDWECYEMDC